MAVLILVIAAGAAPAASDVTRVGATFFLVRPDPRLCPSPLCGGYWVSLANHARTRCSDGALRSRCYVARASDEKRHPLRAPIPDGALARAQIQPWRYEGIGNLGVLVVARVFAPAGRTPPAGRHFRLVDTGIRCVKAPCFSLRALELNREKRVTLSGLDLRAAQLEPAERARAESALGASGGLLVQGDVVTSNDGGRELRATRVFLREPSPRA